MWAGVPATPPSFVTPREEATADEPIRRETVPGPAPGSAEFHVGNSFMIDVTQGRRANQLRVNDVALTSAAVLRPKVACAEKPISRADPTRSGRSILQVKIFRFIRRINCAYIAPSRAHQRGGRVVTNVEPRCDGRCNFNRRVSLQRTVKACGPDLPTLGSSLAR